MMISRIADPSPVLPGNHGTGFSILLLSVLCIWPTFQAIAQPNAPEQPERIVFEPHLISLTTDTGLSQSETNSRTLDEAGIISTPQRALYVNELEVHEDDIYQGIIEDGVYSDELINSYLSMARIFSQEQKFDQARESFESALRLIRIEHGLDTELQLPVLNALAYTQMHLGNIEETYDIHTTIKQIRSEYHGDDLARSASNTLQYADSLLSLAEHAYLHNLSDPVQLASYFMEAKVDFQGAVNLLYARPEVNRDTIRLIHERIVASGYYFEKLLNEQKVDKVILDNIMHRINRSSKSFLRHPKGKNYPSFYDETEDSISASSFRWMALEHFSYEDIYRFSHPPLIESLRILQYELKDMINRNEDVTRIAEAMIELADWSLMVGAVYTGEAWQLYTDAYNLLVNAGVENKDALLKQYFDPDLPVQIPPSFPHDYTFDGYREVREVNTPLIGYIDVSYQVGRNGDTRNIRVEAKSQGLDEHYEKLLLQNLKQNQYRPAFENHQPIQRDYSLRYYVSVLDAVE